MISNAQLTPREARRVVHTSWARALAAHALQMGAERYGLFEVRWDCSGGCEDPVRVLFEGRPEARPFTHRGARGLHAKAFTFYGDGFDRDQRMSVLMLTRCRRCRVCLRARQFMWSQRAKFELANSARTWFGTLTLRAEEHYLAELRARRDCKAQSTDFDKLSPEAQFKARHRAIAPELTLWLKRVRKESGASARYLLVAEAHKSGLPHYHVLVHEVGESDRIGERVLRRQWKLGHSKFNLVDAGDPRAARYVCKYLSKAAEARVRASLRYGVSSRPDVVARERAKQSDPVA